MKCSLVSLIFLKRSLLLSHFSRVRLCATPETAAHQAPPSLGFSRQKHWSGLPFPSPMHESESEVAQSCSTLHNFMDCSLTGSSIHRIFQARVLEWGAIAFSEEISSLSFPFYCFPLFLFTDHGGRLSYLSLLFFGTLHSDGYVFPFFLCLSLLFSAIYKVYPDNHFAFLHFFFLGMVSIPVSCTMSQTSVHSSSGTLSIRSSPLNLFLTTTYSHKGFYLGHI